MLIKYGTEDNPITKKHQRLLDLLKRVGLVFQEYKYYKHGAEVCYIHPCIDYADVQVLVLEDGTWQYGKSINFSVRSSPGIEDEEHLTNFLSGTTLGNLLFDYKLNLLRTSLLD